MGIFYRYIASKFWGPFFFGMGVFSMLAFLTDFFDHMSSFAKTTAPMGVILNYFAHSMPFWMLMIAPVAALLAELFSISELISSGEWTAGVAGGFRPRQLALPIMLCCALVCVAHFTLSETVSPGLRRRAEFIYERQISGNKNYHQDVKTDVAARVAEGSFISAAELNTQTGEMKKAVYTFEYKGRVRYQVEADTANWRRGRWVFNNALERTFLQSGAMTMRNRAQWDSGVDIEPQLLSADKIWPEDLTLFELLHRISVLKRIGSPFRREEVFAHSKLAAPLINFILCLTALPFAIKVRRAGKMLHFTAALGMAFFFWWVASVFQSTGEAGMLSPIAAAWLPPVVFGAIALFLLKKSGI